MTLVAALRIDGVPALLGDFLVTDGSQRPHSHLSTRPSLAGKTPGNAPRIAGLRKKIHRISPWFVVGFTGALVGGHKLINELVSRFGKSKTSPREVASFLADANFPYKRQSALVGWIVHRRRPVCFSWRGCAPHSFDLKPHFGGTGAAHFQKSIMPFDHAGMSPAIHTAGDRAAFKAVTKIGRLLVEELSSGANLQTAYGFGGECMLWDGLQFRYLEKLTYVFWNVEIRPDNSLAFKLADVIIVYRSYDLFSVMQVSQLEFAAAGAKSRTTEVQVITSMHDDAPDTGPAWALVQALESPILFTGLIVLNPLKQQSATFCAASENDPERAIAGIKDGQVLVNWRLVAEQIPPALWN